MLKKTLLVVSALTLSACANEKMGDIATASANLNTACPVLDGTYIRYNGEQAVDQFTIATKQEDKAFFYSINGREFHEADGLEYRAAEGHSRYECSPGKLEVVFRAEDNSEKTFRVLVLADKQIQVSGYDPIAKKGIYLHQSLPASAEIKSVEAPVLNSAEEAKAVEPSEEATAVDASEVAKTADASQN